MSINDCNGREDKACPKCNGPVEWWFFDSDCRGNPPSKGARCLLCNSKLNFILIDFINGKVKIIEE